MDKALIKVGICVAYDWEYLKISLPLIYKHSDTICLSLDRNRTSWSGKKYVFDNDAFYNFINEIDTQKKIIVYEDDFYVSDHSPMHLEVLQRKKMIEVLGNADWYIQIDVDEYFIDFKSFVLFLTTLNSKKPCQIQSFMLPMYKKTDEGYFVVKFTKDWESLPMATNLPSYEYGRVTSHKVYWSNTYVLHESWARTEEQVRTKIDSWGHASDISNKDKYIQDWVNLNSGNYLNYKNIHPVRGEAWPELDFVPCSSVYELLEIYKAKNLSNTRYTKVLLKNKLNIGILNKLKTFLSFK